MPVGKQFDQRAGFAHRRPDRSSRDDQGCGKRLDPAEDVRDEPKGRLVRPMCIIDRDQERLPFGQIRGQPVEAVEHTEQRDRGLARRVEHGGGGQSCRPRQQPLAFLALRRAQDWLEALANHAERVSGLELDPPRSENEHPGLGSAFVCAGQKHSLSDPGAALDDHGNACAVAC